MQLTNYREEVKIMSNEKLNQYSNQQVMPLNIPKGDEGGTLVQRSVGKPPVVVEHAAAVESLVLLWREAEQRT